MLIGTLCLYQKIVVLIGVYAYYYKYHVQQSSALKNGKFM